MSHALKPEDNKDPQIPIPTICIENNYCSESSAQDSPPCGLPSPFFVSDGDALFERVLPLNLQVGTIYSFYIKIRLPNFCAGLVN